jgi:hypothetical protein
MLHIFLPYLLTLALYSSSFHLIAPFPRYYQFSNHNHACLIHFCVMWLIYLTKCQIDQEARRYRDMFLSGPTQMSPRSIPTA